MLRLDSEALKKKLPVLFDNLSLNSPEEKLGAMSSLNSTLMSLSLALDSAQKRATKEEPEMDAVKNLCDLSREIRCCVQLRFDVAREMATMEKDKIKLAMEIERHNRSLSGRESK